MLGKFCSKLALDDGYAPLASAEHIKSEKELIKYMEGRSWAGGLYRTFEVDSQREWRDLIGLAFNGYEKTVIPFGYDWLGRLYCLDSQREHQNQHLILMFDPASFAAYNIPANLLGFYNVMLCENDKNFLSLDKFRIKIAEVNGCLASQDCFGYRIPEFLGGELSVENLELTQIKFYWEITTQIHDGIADLPAGENLNSVRIE